MLRAAGVPSSSRWEAGGLWACPGPQSIPYAIPGGPGVRSAGEWGNPGAAPHPGCQGAAEGVLQAVSEALPAHLMSVTF